MTATLVTVKQSFITRLKGMSTVVSQLNGGAVEVREFEWQGTDFKYPCIRVKIDEFKRHEPTATCRLYDGTASIHIFADDASSLKADMIASTIFDLLDTKSFTDQITGTHIMGIFITQMGAGYITESGAWASNLSLSFQAN